MTRDEVMLVLKVLWQDVSIAIEKFEEGDDDAVWGALEDVEMNAHRLCVAFDHGKVAS